MFPVDCSTFLSMRKPLTIAIGFIVAVAAVVGIVASSGADESAAPYIAVKPDPLAGTPGTERPGFIRANEPCGPHEGGYFEEGEFGFSADVVLDDLDAPTVLEFFDEDTAYIGQRDGLVLLWDLELGVAEPVIDLTDSTGTKSDQGLVGLAVTPDRQFLLIHYTTEDEESKIVAQPLVDGVPRVTGRAEVLTVEQPSEQHNGGTIEFDSDGYLWMSFGDGGGQGDKYLNAQDPSTPLGSMLRVAISPDDLSVQGAPGNPYADGVDGHPWTFATGIRNPFRFSIDPVTGFLWIADVGQACVEEITVLDPDGDVGANLGWPAFEGDRPFLGTLTAPHHAPVFSYWRDGGYCVVVGGEVYRGLEIDELVGLYVFSDHCRSEIIVFDPDTEIATRTGVTVDSPLDFSSDPEGELYAVSMTGSILRLRP